MRKALDILRPGDTITLTHVDGVLQSLNRRISNTLTLSVARGDDGFAVDFIEQKTPRPCPTKLSEPAETERGRATQGVY